MQVNYERGFNSFHLYPLFISTFKTALCPCDYKILESSHPQADRTLVCYLHRTRIAHIPPSLKTDGRRGKGVDSHQGLTRWLKYHQSAITLGTREWGRFCRHSMVDTWQPTRVRGACLSQDQAASLSRGFVGSALHTRSGPAQQLIRLHRQWPGTEHLVGRIPVWWPCASSRLGWTLSLCSWY